MNREPYSAEKARGGEIIFIAGLVGVAVVAVIARLAMR
jgi:hypothetical protein